MKTTILMILVLAITAVYASPIYAGIRCGNDIISPGDTSSEVMIKLNMCGKILDKEVVSRETIVDTDENRTVDKVKKEKTTVIWYIRVKERGGMYCYPLYFEEGLLQRIGKWSRCD